MRFESHSRLLGEEEATVREGATSKRERENRKKDGARRMDSPVSHSLADRERITMRSLPLLSVSLRPSVGPPVHPFARPLLPLVRSSVCLPVHPIVSSSASCHSPRQPPDGSLASGIHLLSCPVLPCPPPLLLLFPPAFAHPSTSPPRRFPCFSAFPSPHRRHRRRVSLSRAVLFPARCARPARSIDRSTGSSRFVVIRRRSSVSPGSRYPHALAKLSRGDNERSSRKGKFVI